MNTYSSYKESGVEWIGEIPSSWDTIKCGYLFRVVSLKNNIGEQNLSVYRDYGVIPRDSRDDNHNRVSEDISNYKLVEVGNFVFNKMKCWMGSLGVSKYRGIVSPSYTVCETTQPFDGKYLHHLLRSKLYIQEFESLSYGVRVGQWELRFHDFRDILSVFPPIQEQQQISNYLDHKTQQIDSLIKKTQQKIELLKEQRTSLINQVVTKGLNPDVEMKDSGVEWIGKIPREWKKTKIGYYSDLVRGSGYQFLEQVDESFEGRKERVIRISDFSEFDPMFCKYEEQFENYRIRKNDILIGGTGHYFGKSIISSDDMFGMIHSYNIIRLVVKKIYPKYCFFYLNSQFIRELMDLSVTGSGQPFLDFERINNLIILIPPFKEQQQIVDYLDTETTKIDSTIEKETQRIDLLKEYRQSLISEVVTGKVDVRDEVVV